MHHDDYVYLAEGNANVVFSYIGGNSSVNGSVLRLAKSHRLRRFKAHEHALYLEKVVLPKFDQTLKDCLIPSQLATVSRHLLERLDQHLQSSSKRPQKYVGSGLNTSAIHGVLLPLLASNKDRKVVEFKPKWLLQSPAAPADATWCRTCALRLRRSTLPFPISALEDRFCPLDLSSQDHGRLLRALSNLDREKGWRLTHEELQQLTTFLQNTSAFQKLAYCQTECGQDVALAMTLRDCSFYIEMARKPQDNQSIWQAYALHIADLDRKSLDKLETWATIEVQLAEEGWHHGKDVPPGTRACIEPCMDASNVSDNSRTISATQLRHVTTEAQH